MTDSAAALARRRILRAAETLAEADILLERARWRGALNRVYYAAFYAARALLATRGLDAAKHSGTIALFQQHFVKAGEVPPDTARALVRAFDKRQATDYADFVDPDPQDVRELRDAVATFVAYCTRRVEVAIAGEGA